MLPYWNLPGASASASAVRDESDPSPGYALLDGDRAEEFFRDQKDHSDNLVRWEGMVTISVSRDGLAVEGIRGTEKHE